MGPTALFAAVANSHLQVAKLLITIGAAVEMQAGVGLSLLWWALRAGNTELIQLLPLDNPDNNIFPDFDRYSDWTICKGKITKDRFPNLQAPNRDGGCVRYYRGIDVTGVVTEQHFFFKDGFKNA
ncbi:hypothetical protein FOCG_03524 [Fusarium oxysporum f. sp. radicis-lycopersici 26381]|nr:hypothetical protein FOCG_03524 [Fusarium oxysporum f. sp. radicis-lycopersici 26381]